MQMIVCFWGNFSAERTCAQLRLKTLSVFFLLLSLLFWFLFIFSFYPVTFQKRVWTSVSCVRTHVYTEFSNISLNRSSGRLLLVYSVWQSAIRGGLGVGIALSANDGAAGRGVILTTGPNPSSPCAAVRLHMFSLDFYQELPAKCTFN